jgi:hypothetical protein
MCARNNNEAGWKENKLKKNIKLLEKVIIIINDNHNW